MYELSQRHPVWVAEIHVTACNSVEIKFKKLKVYKYLNRDTVRSPPHPTTNQIEVDRWGGGGAGRRRYVLRRGRK